MDDDKKGAGAQTHPDDNDLLDVIFCAPRRGELVQRRTRKHVAGCAWCTHRVEREREENPYANRSSTVSKEKGRDLTTEELQALTSAMNEESAPYQQAFDELCESLGRRPTDEELTARCNELGLPRRSFGYFE